MILELHNVRMEPSNVSDSRNVRRTVTYDVGTAQCEDETVKCEKKVREPLNATKELLYMMLESHNVRMKPSNMRKK